MNKPVNTRSISLDILSEIFEKGEYTHIVLSAALKKYQYLANMERSFISRTVLGTVERVITIDYVINSFSKIKVAKMKPVIRNILRMSVYQIIYMEGTKDFAVCDEAVKLAVKRGFSSLKGFVNGVLRNIVREKDNISYEDNLSVKYSTPEWLVDKWLKEYDRETVEGMLKAQFTDRPLSVRCNTAGITRTELIKRLEDQGITAVPVDYLEEAVMISGYDYLDKIPEFREGLFFVQDISSMLVCHVAAPAKDSYVIDVCAAPGGKSMHMAEMLNGTGHVEARDLTESKVMLIRENIERLKLDNISAKVMDATVYEEASTGKADVLLADLPCSGFGILNKKPDIKYHASPEKCQELAKLQREILKNVSKYVKPGGTLVYSTCTVNPEENINNAKWFADNYDYEMEDVSKYLPECFLKYVNEGCLELKPGTDTEYDGFFIARFVRK